MRYLESRKTKKLGLQNSGGEMALQSFIYFCCDFWRLETEANRKKAGRETSPSSILEFYCCATIYLNICRHKSGAWWGWFGSSRRSFGPNRSENICWEEMYENRRKCWSPSRCKCLLSATSAAVCYEEETFGHTVLWSVKIYRWNLQVIYSSDLQPLQDMNESNLLLVSGKSSFYLKMVQLWIWCFDIFCKNLKRMKIQENKVLDLFKWFLIHVNSLKIKLLLLLFY